MHDGTAAHRWCCTETWTAIQECCIVSKKSKKPLKSLLKPIFHLLKPSPSLCWPMQVIRLQCGSAHWVVYPIIVASIQLWRRRKNGKGLHWPAVRSEGFAELTGAACNPRLPPSWIRCQKSRYPHQHTIQSYFYFRYINANDNLLFIIHQYHFLSFSHHWELFHNQMEKKEVLRWESGSSWSLK